MLKRPEQMATNQSQVELSNLDRLSSLPDGILRHIMFFLGAQQAVKTCILSKRWKNLWRYSPAINFSRVDFNCDRQFIDFVNTFFNHREKTKIDIFRLDLGFHNFDSKPIKSWIVYALNFRPRVISIRIIPNLFANLADSLFACNSVEAIELHISSEMLISSSIPIEEIKSKPIPLLNLKRLNLTQVPLNDELMKKLISGSPRLAELILDYCPLYTSDITITSHSLKILSIQKCCCLSGFAFHLYIPSLLSLHVLGADVGDIRVDGLPSLLKACVHYNQVFFRSPESSYELLRALSNVTHLELIGKAYQRTIKSNSMRISVLKNLLEKELLACRDFVNLKKLHLSDWCMSDDFDIIAHFIQLSPNLETLTLCHEKDILHEGQSEKFYLQIQLQRPEMIEIKCSIEHERVNQLINTLKTHLGTSKKFSVDISGNFSVAFCKTNISILVSSSIVINSCV